MRTNIQQAFPKAITVLPLSRYRFNLQALEDIQLPAYSGSAWRGVLGHALKRTVCVTRERDCRGCLLYRSCVYPYLFETPPAPQAQKLRKYPAAPHPFVIEPWPNCPGAPAQGDLGFDAVLYGRGRHHLPYLVQACMQMGRRGIGRGQGRFELQSVDQEMEEQGWQEIFRPQGRLQPLETDISRIPPCPAGGRLRLVLLTPLRLKRDEHLVTPEQFGFRDFFANLLRRISLLTYFHAGEDLDVDFRALIAAAAEVPLAAAQLHWHDWTRYSSRQETTMQLGGLLGWFALEADMLAPFWPYLWLGQWTHAGKATSMGLGRYRIEPDAPAAAALGSESTVTATSLPSAVNSSICGKLAS